MNNTVPHRIEDIDDFFKSNLEDATDAEFDATSMWDQLSTQLDIVNQAQISSAANASQLVVNPSGISSSFIGGISIKGITIIGSIISVMTAGTYFYINHSKTENPTSTPIVKEIVTDSLEVLKPKIALENFSSIKQSSKSNAIETIKKEEHSIKVDSSQKSVDLTAETEVQEEFKIKTVDAASAEPIIEEKNHPVENLTENEKDHSEESAEIMKEKLMEQAKKKARPLFKPHNPEKK